MKELLYLVFYKKEGLETDHIKVFANSAQEAADIIRAKRDVEDVFGVYLPAIDWH